MTFFNINFILVLLTDKKIYIFSLYVLKLSFLCDIILVIMEILCGGNINNVYS